MHNGQNVRFAILGCGAISRVHLEGIQRTEEAELVAVCDVSEERAREVGAAYGVPYYTDYEKMLKQDNIEVINICTPSGMHPEQTLLAAQAGKHVMVEKPIAIRQDDIHRMVEACEEHGVLIAAIYPRRMSPAAQYVKAFIEQGGLGKLSLCTAVIKPYRDQTYYDSAGWRGTWAMDGGGVLMNQGIHTIDLLLWLVGPVDSLYAKTEHLLRKIEVEDTATVLLQFGNQTMGIIEASTTAYKQPAHQVTLHGEKGTIILTEDAITTFDLVDGNVELPPFEPFKAIPDGHRLQIRDMALAVRELRQPIVTGREGKQALDVILKIYESSQMNKEIVLKSC